MKTVIKLEEIGLLLLGIYLGNDAIVLFGIILFSHSSIDRAFGYGLKYLDSFNNTHLGKLGKRINL